MDDAEFYRGSRFEILNKTIAMIHASPAYQRYAAQKRRQAALNTFKGDWRYATRRPQLSEKVRRQKWCIRCENPMRGGERQICARCRVVTVRQLLDSGLTTSQIASKQKMSVAYVNLLFKRSRISSVLGRHAR